jgi:hypothetical protein
MGNITDAMIKINCILPVLKRRTASSSLRELAL